MPCSIHVDDANEGDTMRAYDLCFENDEGSGWSWSPGGTAADGVEPAPGDPVGGWIGTVGPAVGDAVWPRGPVTGLPMFHAITLRLPDDWRVRGPEYVAISLFQGEGQFADPDEKVEGDAASDDPFVRGLAEHRAHATEQRFEDEIGGVFAMLWLTEAEYADSPASPPEDVRRDDEHTNDDEGPNAWDDEAPFRRVRLVERDDPNAGTAPTESGDGDFHAPFDGDASDWRPWAEPLANRMHLGGTMFPAQAVPGGFGPRYLEIRELPGMNLGGDGALQVDLETDAFGWACG